MEKQYIVHPWKIIEKGFIQEKQRASESIFSLGNGKMGMRANFEEAYSGSSLQGTYLAGIYYPDKTRVGWWKNGYPEYFAKVLNAPSFIDFDIYIDSEQLDLATWYVTDFERELDMKNGVLRRSFTATSPVGKTIQVFAHRFLSMDNPNIAVIKYAIRALSQDIELKVISSINGEVVNEDSNYDEQFWNITQDEFNNSNCCLLAQTNKLNFKIAMAMRHKVKMGNTELDLSAENTSNNKNVSEKYNLILNADETITFEKYIGVTTSLDFEDTDIASKAMEFANDAAKAGYEKLFDAHSNWWHKKWKTCSIDIEGDDEAQQGIHFNIFQLYQTYTGTDSRLNIGPKGFTGEKYGGSTYWDTEAYCLPFYMSTSGKEVAENLLMYRYKHLDYAKKNAEKLGYNTGAALYPMVTMNGEECHNEWEITFEEIHRNGAIAYAIFYYTAYTGNYSYLDKYGIEVLIAISRFWAERVSFSKNLNKYVILGVTGPNEYENNVNNNWYTNYIARWCIEYTLESLQRKNSVGKNIVHQKELGRWKEIAQNIYLPEDIEKGIFLQQDGFLDKELIPVSKIPSNEKPINQHWSWDRILRSCYIKQADVMQGLYFFEDHFDYDTIKRNFEFYEPLTVHESSLSPCIYSIQASYLDKKDLAYELYLRTSRLDLDDYNKEVHEGLHITSMAGTWMSIVIGFGGMRIQNDKLQFTPKLPDQWKGLSFHVNFRDRLLKVYITNDTVDISLIKGKSLEVIINGNLVVVS